MAKLFLIVACLALSHAALVKRDAPASSPLEDIQKHATEFSKTFSEQLNSLTTSKNAEEFTKVLQESSNDILNKLSVFATSLQGVAADANGKVKEALEASKANIQRTAEDLRKSHPEVEQQATALKERLSTAVQNAVQESQKLAKTVSENVEQTNKALEPKIQAAYNDFIKQVQEIQKKVHESATKQ